MRLRTALLAVLLALPLASCSRAARHAAAVLPDTGVVAPATSAQVIARAIAPGAAVTLVNVWATWCGPCREEFPVLLAAARRHPGARLVLVSADFETQAHDVRAFLAAHGVRDTTFLKHEGDQSFIDGLEPKWTGALPLTLVYDASGRRTAWWEGAADSARFETALVSALHGSPSQEATR
jgi:thiol-disulfide isomerase/thioredoxin